MKKFLKILSLGLVVTILSMAFTGCGHEKKAKVAKEEESTDKKVYTIGICQQGDHESLNEATSGFKKALVDKLGGDGVKFIEDKKNDNIEECRRISSEFVDNNVDLIMANSTGALQSAALATKGTKIPVVGTSIADYSVALTLDERGYDNGSKEKIKEKSEINVTGTSDNIPPEEIIGMIKDWKPDVKQVGFIYSSEANSTHQINLLIDALGNTGISYKTYRITDKDKIQSGIKSACDECDILYIPADNMLASNINIVKQAISNNIPILCGVEDIAKECGIATISVDYFDIGYASGEMAYDILVNGKNPGEMKIQKSKNFKKLYIPDRVKALNLPIPEGYKAITQDEGDKK